MTEQEKKHFVRLLLRLPNRVARIDTESDPSAVHFTWSNQTYRYDGSVIRDWDGRLNAVYSFETSESMLIQAIIRQPRWTKAA